MRPAIQQATFESRPTADFLHFDLRPELLRALAAAGFRAPRPIQAQALPPALAGRDVLGLAQTGTGKTAAFVLPILQRFLEHPGGQGPRALVVVPTRELAAQVHAEFERLAVDTPIRAAVVFGGVPIARQERLLRTRPEVIVACPGRLLDLHERRALRLDRIEVLVLDEADHMFDMGFLPDVRRILSALPGRRQNLLFSATMPREVRLLADGVLRAPAVVELGHSKPAETIAHGLVLLGEQDKQPALESLVGSDDFRSAIVFLRTKRRARVLAQQLCRRGHRAVALQGNMSQSQRERALRAFRDGRYDLLVATDIAARGLDIAGVSHVVNFDVPGTPDAYTHRIGRTGRSGESGRALTFVAPGDAPAVRAIEKRLGAALERMSVAGFTPSHGRHGTSGSPSEGPARAHRRAHQPAPAGGPARTRAPRPMGPGPRPQTSRGSKGSHGGNRRGKGRGRGGHARESAGMRAHERNGKRNSRRKRHGDRQR